MANEKIGSWAFILGVLLAIVLGLAGSYFPDLHSYLVLALVVLGLLVGLINITDKEIKVFLIAAIALSMVGGISSGLLAIDTVLKPVGTYLQMIVQYIATFVYPAALVVALKAFYLIARSPEPSKL